MNKKEKMLNEVNWFVLLTCVNWDIGTLGHWDNELKMNTFFNGIH